VHVPGFITRNFRLKLGCTIFAMITWVGVVYAGNPPETRTVSLQVPQAPSAIPARFILVQPVPPVAIRIGGARSSLDGFSTASLTVKVNWQSVTTPGEHQVPITITNADSNVELIDPPTSVTANLDTRSSISTPVTIRVTNPPPQGYVISSEAAAPASVVIVGPEQQLKGLEARVTVDLQNQKTNLVVQQALVLIYDARGVQVGDVDVTPGTVKVSIIVAANQTTRAAAVVPRTTGSPASGHYLAGLSASPASVVLAGPQDLLNALDSISTSTISLQGLTGSETLTLALVPPPGVTASPATVTVTIVINALPTPAPTPTPSPSAPATP